MVLGLLEPRTEAGTVYQACQGTGLAQKVLGCCKGFPAQLEGRSARWMRAVAAASGGSNPTSIATSGNAARGGVCTGSVLSLTAVNDTEIASRKGSVICQFLLKGRQGDPEK